MTTAASVTILQTALKAVGGTFPKAVIKMLDERERLAAAVAAMPTGHGETVMAAVANALLANRDPLVDADVIRLTVAKILGGDSGDNLSRGVERVANDRVATALAEHVDEVIATFKTGADTAGQTLIDAHQLLGDTALTDAATVAKLGAAATQAWDDAKGADRIIRAVTHGWHALGELTGQMSATPSRTLLLCDVTLEQFEQVGHMAQPWPLTQLGLVVDFADRTTIKTREQALNEQRQRRTENAESAYGTAYQRQAGIAS